MKTHDVSIYHFISCGRIVHDEPDVAPTHCCGHTMVKVVTETIHEGDIAGETPGGKSGTAPQVDDRTKPR